LFVLSIYYYLLQVILLFVIHYPLFVFIVINYHLLLYVL